MVRSVQKGKEPSEPRKAVTEKKGTKTIAKPPPTKRRRKRGVLAKRNIIRHQKDNVRIIEKAPFKRLLRGMLNDLGYTTTGLRHGVVDMLMDYFESRYISTMRLGDILAKADKRTQVKERDLELAADIDTEYRRI